MNSSGLVVDRGTQLCQLELQNFLSFGPQEAEFLFGNLNVLVGPNGSGKTNLFEAIRVLRSCVRDFGSPMYANGGVEAYLWRGEGAGPLATVRAFIVVKVADGVYEHEVQFRSGNGRVALEHESVKPSFENNGSGWIETLELDPDRVVNRLRTTRDSVFQVRGDVRVNESGLERARDSSMFPILTGIGDFYETIRIYSEWTIGQSSPARRSVPAGTPSDILLEDSSNLAFVLAELRSTRSLPKIRAALRRLKETYEDFSIRPVGGQLQLYVEEQGVLGGINAMRLSDGTLRYLALAAVLLHPNPPPLILIDEPEVGLHPDLIEGVSEMIIEACTKTQVIVATHSPDLLSYLRSSIDRLYAFQAGPNGSEARGFSRTELEDYLVETPLGELWKQGDFGGNRF
jgi:predicted ATPase